ncbi:hypothetical protein M911_03995 [Ectothiorhodospira haloalkaliphila]|uniref:Uncharacterized protein n=1 Tax=Ectothiorhodospira haloalkaliphila TaxID=421628 RepID=W8KYH5_9GAMM|nr:hypothetical protein [Ectothiorhodospira haloalkaliphila]AHK80596.1 hypothetical protein M911_03995 [Ectothiorhodospira haloalkaliphila]
MALVLFTLCGVAQAWTPGLKTAAQMVAQGTATPHQEMLVFFSNREVNLAAVWRELPIDQYNAVQEHFHALNRQFSRQAVENAGFRAEFGGRGFNPGTDTDVNVLATGGRRITLEDIQRIEAEYQRVIREHFGRQGVRTPVERFDTDTDFMPHPNHTDQFDQIVRHINQRGGTAYATPGAVRTQMALAQGAPGDFIPISINDAMDFSAEMRRLSQASDRSANAWLREAEAMQPVNPRRAELFRAQAQLAESQSAKYISRQFSLDNHLRLQHDLNPVPLGDTGLDQALSRLHDMGRGVATARDAAAVRAMNRHGLQRASDQLVDTFGTLARLNPTQGGQFSRAIAQEISRMSPSKAGEAIGRLERSVGGDFAQSVARETRRLHATRRIEAVPNAAPPPRGVSAVRIMMAGVSGYFMGREGVYHALDQTEADDTAFDFFMRVYQNAAWYGTGVGHAYEEAERAEIQRFMREVERGNDPSLTRHVSATLLQIPYLMARDSVTGILYLPDAIVEAITGTKEAEAREQASKEFLAEIRRLVRHREQIDEAFAHAEAMGVRPEDSDRFLDCLCNQCGGMLGGYFCVGSGCRRPMGSGPCVCKGPLNTWNTPIPSGTEDSLGCFNAITRRNHQEAQAVFDSWQARIPKENYKSVEADVEEVKWLLEQGDFEQAARSYQPIAPVLAGVVDAIATDDGVMHTPLDRHLEGRIAGELINQARDHQARQEYQQALDAYQAALSVWPDDEVKARAARLERYLAVQDPQEAASRAEAARVAPGQPGDDREGMALTPPREQAMAIERGSLDGQQREQAHELRVEGHGHLTVEVQADGDLQLALQLRHAEGADVLTQDRHGRRDSRRVEQPDLAPGLYEVRVLRQSGEGDYVLTPQLRRVSIPNDREPNDSAEQAQSIPVNQVSTGLLGYRNHEGRDTEDWYQVTLPAHGRLTVDIEAEEALRLAAQLRDEASTGVLHQDHHGRRSQRQLERADLAPGTYHVRIMRHEGHGGYTLLPRLDAVGEAGELARHDSMELARPIEAGHEVTGLLGYRDATGRDTEDWFRLTLPTSGQLFVYVRADEDLQLAAQLRDAGGSRNLAEDHHGRESRRRLELGDLEPGTYYLRVYRQAGQGSYRLTTRLHAR